MGDPVTWAAIGTALTAGSAAYGISESNKAKDEQKKMAKQQQDKQDALAKEAKDAQAKEEQMNLNKKTRDLQKLNSLGYGGRSSTLLTGPSGLGSAPAAGGKTLLGM